MLILGKTFFKRLVSKTSEILVEDSPAESSGEVPAEGGEEHHEVRGGLPGLSVGQPHDHQAPETQGDQYGGKTKQFLFMIIILIL